jgi:hypothetical protein
VVVDGRGGVIRVKFMIGRVRRLLAVLRISGKIDASDLMFSDGPLALFFNQRPLNNTSTPRKNQTESSESH